LSEFVANIMTAFGSYVFMVATKLESGPRLGGAIAL